MIMIAIQKFTNCNGRKQKNVMSRANIQLYNADCMEAMKDMKDNQFDLAIVDPPYYSGSERRKFYGSSICKSLHSKTGKISIVKKTQYKIRKKWKVPNKIYFNELKRVSKNQIIFGINYFKSQSYFPGRIIWNKVNYKSSFSDCEIALCTFHSSVRLFEYMWNGMMQGKSVLDGKTQQGNKKLNEARIHPTQKPVILYKWLLKNYAKEGDKILDTHLGSGSIAIGCWDMEFDLTGYDIDEEYYNNAVARLECHKKQGQLF